MARGDTVVRSVNAPDGGRCVDIFARPDGTFGFEEFRRDAEDPGGWFPVGGHAGKVFATAGDALRGALAGVPWLRDAAGDCAGDNDGDAGDQPTQP